MTEFKKYLLAGFLILLPLYPKFPLANVAGSFVAIRLEDLAIAIVVSIWLIDAIRRKFDNENITEVRTILFYWLVGLVSVFSAVFLTKTVAIHLGVLHSFRRIEYMIMFIIGMWGISDRRQLNFLLGLLLVVSTLVSIYGLGQQFFGFPIISTTNSEFSKGLALSLGNNARINSTFAGHYDLAAFCIIPLLLILGIWSETKRLTTRLFLVISGGLVYWTMLLSASRVTFLALMIAAVSLATVLKRWTTILLIMILAFLGIVASPQLRGRYWEFLTNHVLAAEDKNVQTIPDTLKTIPEDRSLNIRLKAEWPRALRAFYKNPILGTGFSSVGLAVDNDYLRVLAETGLLGMVTLSLVMSRIVKKLWVSTDIFAKTMLFSLIGLLINAIFIDIFEASKVASLTWLLLGMAVKSSQLRHEQI